MFRAKMMEYEIHRWMFISGVIGLLVIGVGAVYAIFGIPNSFGNFNTSTAAETCVVRLGEDSTTAFSVPGKKGDC